MLPSKLQKHERFAFSEHTESFFSALKIVQTDELIFSKKVKKQSSEKIRKRSLLAVILYAHSKLLKLVAYNQKPMNSIQNEQF